jgi:transcriptional regulator with XRE-family HTH domain
LPKKVQGEDVVATSRILFKGSGAVPAQNPLASAVGFLKYPNAKVIRRKRKGLRMTQADVAEKCHVAANSIGRIERGQERPSADLAHKIARVLKMSDTDFWSGREPILPQSPIEERLLVCFRDLEAEWADYTFALITALAAGQKFEEARAAAQWNMEQAKQARME